MRLKLRLLAIRDGTDIVTFVEQYGRAPDRGPTLPEAPRSRVTLAGLKER
jgi:hypothetical protein